MSWIFGECRLKQEEFVSSLNGAFRPPQRLSYFKNGESIRALVAFAGTQKGPKQDDDIINCSILWIKYKKTQPDDQERRTREANQTSQRFIFNRPTYQFCLRHNQFILGRER
jgi:hypothetical protein